MLFLTVAFLFGWCSALRLSVFAEPGDPQARLLAGLLACEEMIDLTDCGIPVSELGRIYTTLLQGHPELFHVAPRLSFGSREPIAGGTVRIVAEVYPTYTLTGQELADARIYFRDTVAAILTEMDAALYGHSRNEAEIVLYLHDLLADRYAYDTRAGSPGADVYTFFRDGQGICQAYALAFMSLARGAGLEADFVSSDVMDHAWNHVRVEGIWYHVDVTRDDPIPAAPGREEVNHDRLLRSDAGMAALGYRDYTCAGGHSCTDTRFEAEGEAALSGFHSAIKPWGADWLGETEDGVPSVIAIEKEGMAVGGAGDVDGDGELTPADLLRVYDPLYPETWRMWLRSRLVEN